ncbi:MAG TPA: Na-translocating system protein MpsC family protein [Solirubrobacterales bacterium]|nr:Na-translocating system protein MpsC family protein [Solirubrobacterales bacterium]
MTASSASNGVPPAGPALTDAISAALVALYADFYEHGRTTATTYINDNVVVCVLEDILSTSESRQVADGAGKDVIDGRIAFQEGAQDEFTQAIEHLTGRKVTAFLSANQASPGVACELFFLEAPPEPAA